MTPIERYQTDLQRADFVHDVAQAQAVQHLQRLYDELIQSWETQHGYFTRLRHQFWRNKAVTIRGLYLWGQVGRGKTYLMDNFYECLPVEQKLRIHFHRFMQQVHHELKQLENIRNPLIMLAEHLAKEIQIICLDEFHVADIADAMLLGGLLTALFERGVTLVATSNIEPDGLYKNGLQRERFLPAIALLKQHTQVIRVDGGIDYRLRALEQAEIYHYPLDELAHQNLVTSFTHLSPEGGTVGEILQINGRSLPTVQCAEGVVWFEFETLCNTPRAVADYIELACCFHTVLLGQIYSLKEENNDATYRFIHLVDEFYDRNVKLIISAEVPLEQLYLGKKHAFQFQRTISRLKEMQSHEYLERPRLP
ncbi:MAG: cell division protein ZapE [Beggiatoa sp. IS2]|nr:MAG: cell division protein ZapE [Beggiatoa sp. IS2]